MNVICWVVKWTRYAMIIDRQPLMLDIGLALLMAIPITNQHFDYSRDTLHQ